MAHFRRQYPSRRSSRLAVGFVCVAVLTACGLIGDDPPETEPPPDPNQTTITAFKTSAAYIERGDEVTLSWEVDNPGSDPSVPEPCTLTRHAQGQEPEEPFGVECTGSLTEVPTAPDTAAYVSYQLNVLKNVDDG